MGRKPRLQSSLLLTALTCLTMFIHTGAAARPPNFVIIIADERELYDLKTDRSETKNLAAALPDRVKELSALWQRQNDAIRALALRDLPPGAGEDKGKRRKAAED